MALRICLILTHHKVVTKPEFHNSSESASAFFKIFNQISNLYPRDVKSQWAQSICYFQKILTEFINSKLMINHGSQSDLSIILLLLTNNAFIRSIWPSLSIQLYFYQHYFLQLQL